MEWCVHPCGVTPRVSPDRRRALLPGADEFGAAAHRDVRGSERAARLKRRRNHARDVRADGAEAFRLLIAVKNYPRLASITLDGNAIGDDFLESFRVFIQDSTIFPALRRISLRENPFSPQTCQQLKGIFLTQYERSTVILC